jgi:hypothetical protein
MNLFKFACPQCQQHIECDASHAGRDVTCPTCQGRLRVPKVTAAIQGQLPTALLIDTAKAPAVARRPTLKKRIAVEDKGPTGSDSVSVRIPRKTGALSTAKPGAPVAKTEREVVHCLCPVCKSELRLPTESSGPGGALQEAHLVKRGAAPVLAGAVGGGSAKGTVGKAQAKVEARDPSVAAAQVARAGGEQKPRMSYVLTGKPPVPKTGRSPGKT